MTYDIYRYIFLGAALLAGIMLITTVVLFFILKIPNVIGDLTGSTARKAIENIRTQNEESGVKTYKSSAVNKERGKITDKISPSNRLIKNESSGFGGAMATEKISKKDSPHIPAEETSLLNDNNSAAGNETTVLGSNETTVLGGNETTLLSGELAFANTQMNETVVLSEAVPTQAAASDNLFTVEYDITYIHSNEVIA